MLPSYGRPGMVQNWDLEIQHQIMQDLILSIPDMLDNMPPV